MKRTPPDEAGRRRRAFLLEQRIARLEAVLAKRRAELAQLDETGPKLLYWISFVELSGNAVDIVVYGKSADQAYVAAARLLDDPRGDPLVFEVPKDLYHGPIGEELRPEQLQQVARLASGTDLEDEDDCPPTDPRPKRRAKPTAQVRRESDSSAGLARPNEDLTRRV